MDGVAEIMEAVTYTQAPVSIRAAPVSGLTVSGCCQIDEVKYQILWGSREGPLLPHITPKQAANFPGSSACMAMKDMQRRMSSVALEN